MKPKVEEGITEIKNKFTESKSTRVGRIEVVYMMVYLPDTHRIANTKIMDELYLPFIQN